MFRHVYIQAKEGKNKHGVEFKINNDRPLKRYDLVTFAVTVPKEETDKKFKSFHLNGTFEVDKMTLEVQRELMRSVLSACLRFAGSHRIHSISYSFDPDKIHDVVILIKFFLEEGEEGPPESVVYERIRSLTEEKFDQFKFGASREGYSDEEDEIYVETF